MKRALLTNAAISAAAIAAAALGGCTFGTGSSYVGQWRPRQRVDFEACLREPGPPGARQSTECQEKKQVITEEPGRRFWGVILTPMQFGASRVRYRADDDVRFRFQPSMEVLRGRGRWAYGVRTGVMFEPTNQQVEEPPPGADPNAEAPTLDMFAMDVSAVGHVSVLERLSLFAGAGYVPYASYNDELSNVGGKGLLGLQLALSKTHSSNYLILTVELDHYVFRLDDGNYRSSGLSGTLGIFF